MEYFKLNVDDKIYELPSEDLTLWNAVVSISARIHGVPFEEFGYQLDKFVFEQSMNKYNALWHTQYMLVLQCDLMPELHKYHFIRELFKFAEKPQYISIFKDILINPFEKTSKNIVKMYNHYFENQFISDYIDYRFDGINDIKFFKNLLINHLNSPEVSKCYFKPIIDRFIMRINSKEPYEISEVFDYYEVMNNG